MKNIQYDLGTDVYAVLIISQATSSIYKWLIKTIHSLKLIPKSLWGFYFTSFTHLRMNVF